MTVESASMARAGSHPVALLSRGLILLLAVMFLSGNGVAASSNADQKNGALTAPSKKGDDHGKTTAISGDQEVSKRNQKAGAPSASSGNGEDHGKTTTTGGDQEGSWRSRKADLSTASSKSEGSRSDMPLVWGFLVVSILLSLCVFWWLGRCEKCRDMDCKAKQLIFTLIVFIVCAIVFNMLVMASMVSEMKQGDRVDLQLISLVVTAIGFISGLSLWSQHNVRSELKELDKREKELNEKVEKTIDKALSERLLEMERDLEGVLGSMVREVEEELRERYVPDE